MLLGMGAPAEPGITSIGIYSSFTLDVLQKRPTTPTLKQYTIDHLRFTTGSFDYTLKVMTELEQQVRQPPPLLFVP